MRAKEFIFEVKKLRKNHRDSLPVTTRTGVAGDPNGPTNFYHKYRLGVAAAGAPDFAEDISVDGPAADDMVMIGFSSADQEIINAAHKKMGYKQKKLSTSKSKESNGVNTTSPVSNWK